MPRIAELSKALAADGIPLLAVTENEPLEAEPYLDENGWSLAVVYDVSAEAGKRIQ